MPTDLNEDQPSADHSTSEERMETRDVAHGEQGVS